MRRGLVAAAGCRRGFGISLWWERRLRFFGGQLVIGNSQPFGHIFEGEGSMRSEAVERLETPETARDAKEKCCVKCFLADFDLFARIKDGQLEMVVSGFGAFTVFKSRATCGYFGDSTKKRTPGTFSFSSDHLVVKHIKLVQHHGCSHSSSLLSDIKDLNHR